MLQTWRPDLSLSQNRWERKVKNKNEKGRHIHWCNYKAYQRLIAPVRLLREVSYPLNVITYSKLVDFWPRKLKLPGLLRMSCKFVNHIVQQSNHQNVRLWCLLCSPHPMTALAQGWQQKLGSAGSVIQHAPDLTARPQPKSKSLREKGEK